MTASPTSFCRYCGRVTGAFTGWDRLRRCAGCEAIVGGQDKTDDGAPVRDDAQAAR